MGWDNIEERLVMGLLFRTNIKAKQAGEKNGCLALKRRKIMSFSPPALP
jgi:hypothetical protein